MIKYQGITTLEVLTDAKNYNNWIAHEILPHIQSPTLEIGAGTGNLSKYFLKHKPLHVTDIDDGLVKHLKKRFGKEKDIFASTLDISQTPLKKHKNYFGSIYAINVLEHIKDDQTALKNMHKVLKHDGRLLLLVPAKKHAYTRLDKELGHFRRYEKDELEKKVRDAGFSIEKIYFFNILGLLSWTVRDRVSRNKASLHPYQIRIFDSIVPLLRFIESFIKIPTGISLIVIAKKL